jgi:hypothetical protein
MAIIRQSLTETANTFSQNQTLNGTANTAPNQTAASASSLMSRTLVDDEPFFNIARCFSPLPVPSTGVLRGTASVNTNGNYVNLAVAFSTAASSYARASLALVANTTTGGFAYGVRSGFMMRAMAAGTGGWPSPNTATRVIMGGNAGVPAASNANALTASGYGLEIIQSGDIEDNSGFIRVFCHNGTTYTAGTIQAIDFSVLGSFGVISNGSGSVSLFYGAGLARPTAINTISGGPTSFVSSQWLDAVVVNSSAASSNNNASITISDMKIITG